MNIEDEILKVSICQKCKDVVRAAILRHMDKDQIDEFLTEVFVHDLAVSTMTYGKYLGKYTYCKCQLKEKFKHNLNITRNDTEKI